MDLLSVIPGHVTELFSNTAVATPPAADVETVMMCRVAVGLAAVLCLLIGVAEAAEEPTLLWTAGIVVQSDIFKIFLSCGLGLGECS